MREADPLKGVKETDRYDENRDLTRGDAACYNYRAVTLEEEAYNGGWKPGDRPSPAPGLNDLFTIGMRGEPGWDDDPQFNNGDATVTHPPAK